MFILVLHEQALRWNNCSDKASPRGWDRASINATAFGNGRGSGPAPAALRKGHFSRKNSPQSSMRFQGDFPWFLARLFSSGAVPAITIEPPRAGVFSPRRRDQALGSRTASHKGSFPAKKAFRTSPKGFPHGSRNGFYANAPIALANARTCSSEVLKLSIQRTVCADGSTS